MSSRAAAPRGGDLPLYQLLELLPSLRVLAPLREALLARSSSDESRWGDGREYATLDERLLDANRIARVVADAARAEARAASRLFEDVGRALEARAHGRVRDAAAILRDSAVVLAGEERFYEAAALLEVALKELRTVGDAELEADVTRRLGMASWRVGRLDRAAEMYRRAAKLSRQIGDSVAEVRAFQGLGDVRAAQGRWREAEEHNRTGLERCAADDPLHRGQIFNNLSQIHRRLGDLEEARRWQHRAEAVWEILDVPAERVVACNNAGLLELEAGAIEAARERLLAGLTLANGDLQRCVLLVNLAEVALRAGKLDDAEHLGREAEEFAILAGAVDILVEAYTVLGGAGRGRGDPNCVAFFEKALDLARDGRFPLPQARAHVEYGRYRHALGDDEEAVAHLDRARSILLSTDAARERAEVEELLRSLAGVGTAGEGG